VPLIAIDLDEETWSAASEARRAEWKLAIAELLRRNVFVFPGVADAWRLRLAPSEQALHVEARAETGETLLQSEVSRDVLTKQVKEYVDVVRRMAQDDGSLHPAQLEALDMGKKVVHDDAARALARALPELGADHETYRRLFTLVLALRVDTTKLTGVYGHRPVR